MELRSTVQMGFLALVATQSVHSIEEASNRLWEAWAPAAAISGFVSSDLATGFAIVNSVIVLFAFWCYAFRIRLSTPSSLAYLWFWTLLEFGNGVGHIMMSINSGGYFPGLATAPLLLATSLFVGVWLVRGAWADSNEVTT